MSRPEFDEQAPGGGNEGSGGDGGNLGPSYNAPNPMTWEHKER